MKNKIESLKIVVLFGALLIGVSLIAQVPRGRNTPPDDGYVPNASTAIKIAEAIWYPIYGEKIYEEKPFKAVLVNEIWIVKGTLNSGGLGGVSYAEIQKIDCKVIKVSHGK